MPDHNFPYASLLKEYAGLLKSSQQYWRFTPFQFKDYPWVSAEHAPLIAALEQLSDQEVDAIDGSSELQTNFFKSFFPAVFTLPELTSKMKEGTEPQPVSLQKPNLPFWLTNGISGRKLIQIESFIQELPLLTGRSLEWCAGKGHLGRLVAYALTTDMHSVEWQATLCDQGRELASKHGIKQHFTQADVFGEAASQLLENTDHALALHACGDLHRHLLETAVSTECQTLNVAPCCYHLTRSSVYSPMSFTGQKYDLELRTEELKLAVQAQVTAGARVRKLRYIETYWRLAYQVIAERYAGVVHYEPLKSIRKQWFSGDFKDFAEWAAQQHGWELPANVNYSEAFDEAKLRLRKVQRMELVRHVFQRVLESYLILDRAVYLQENGYEVSVKYFCDYSVTPRNFLIQAWNRK